MPRERTIPIRSDLDIVTARVEGRELAKELGFGVIDQARRKAFAASGGQQRIYPDRDDQARFSLVLATQETLDPAVIAHDGVVLVDVAFRFVTFRGC